jgi:uncharacterized protein (DUF2164 family)
MAQISFTRDETVAIAGRIKQWLDEELGIEVGGFDAELLLDFMAREFGPRFYNQALLDAQALIAQRTEAIAEALTELEQPLP